MNAIINKIEELVSPASYYAGISEPAVVMPDNILVFGRHSRQLPSKKDNVHHRFLLALNFKGNGSAIVDGIRFSLFPNHCMLIFPHQYHHFFYDTTDISWLFITFELNDEKRFEKLKNSTIALSQESYKLVEDLLRSYDLAKRFDLIERTKIIFQTALLLNELLKGECSREETPIGLVDEVNRYIYTNINRPLTISELADEFSYSVSHLRLMYRKAMGISLGRYIKETKLHKAQTYLSSTDMSIGQIARACGYDSLYSFSHAFKNYLGISPLGFRKRQFLE